MATRSPARPAVPRTEVRRLVTAVLAALLTVLALGLAGAVPAKAAADYTQSVTSTGSGSVRIGFQPTTPASLVDVHQSSVQLLANANPPTGLTLGVGW
jgi:cell division protein FtsN